MAGRQNIGQICLVFIMLIPYKGGILPYKGGMLPYKGGMAELVS